MNIRTAKITDLPGIIALFRVSLGEEGGVPSTEFWRWKHFDNPFGKSPTLLMLDGEKIVGLRTFMYWQWRWRGNTLRSLRCVDTATHPEYRGRGIFKKLTLKLVEEVETGNLSKFIFNTPNAMSMPGYLKMGWEVAGKTPLYLKLHALTYLTSVFAKPNLSQVRIEQIAIDDLLETYKNERRDHLTTDFSKEYFAWRYQNIPGIEYNCWVDDDTNPRAMFFYRVKLTRGMKELRILDQVSIGGSGAKIIFEGIKEVAKYERALVSTVLKPRAWSDGLMKRNLYLSMEKHGLTITRKSINDHDVYAELDPSARWDLSSGTIELF